MMLNEWMVGFVFQIWINVDAGKWSFWLEHNETKPTLIIPFYRFNFEYMRVCVCACGFLASSLKFILLGYMEIEEYRIES